MSRISHSRDSTVNKVRAIQQRNIVDEKTPVKETQRTNRKKRPRVGELLRVTLINERYMSLALM
jgi:hypothetical protein